MGQLSNIFICLALLSPIFTLQEIVFPPPPSDECKTANGEIGICISIKKCASAIYFVQRGLTPNLCGFIGTDPIICCPCDSENPTDGLLERQKKLGVAPPAINFICGERGSVQIISDDPSHSLTRRRRRIRRDFRITVVGGIDAFKNSWPWMALLGRETNSSTSFFCSAIVINNNFLLTAAHCLLSTEPFFVRLGEHDYGPESGKTVLDLEEDVQVGNLYIHPKYQWKQVYSDIALIELEKPIKFRSEISPICLPWGGYTSGDLINERVTLAGWGTKIYGGRESNILQEVNVTVFDPSRCSEGYSTLREYRRSFPEGMTIENIICAGEEEGNKDACQGDSGGPLMNYDRETNTYFLAGVISRGFGCGLKEFPGLYAPVRNVDNLQWIKDTAFSQG